MIEYIRGSLAELSPSQAIVDCGGVGYLLNISLTTYSELQGKETVKLFVFENIREDAYLLYGFGTKNERNLFLLLMSVNGIGGQTARMILSAYSANELCDIISSHDEHALRGIKGIGPKAAQRIIIELSDKVLSIKGESSASVSTLSAQGIASEAISALSMLGFVPASAEKVVRKVLKENPSFSVEDVIKMGLKLL